MAIVYVIANFLLTKNDIIVHYNKFPNLEVYLANFPNLKGLRAPFPKFKFAKKSLPLELHNTANKNLLYN